MTDFNAVSPQTMPFIIKPQAQQAKLYFGAEMNADTFEITVGLTQAEKREVASNVALGFGVMAKVLDYPIKTISLISTLITSGYIDQELTELEEISRANYLKDILFSISGLAGEKSEHSCPNEYTSSESLYQAEVLLNDLIEVGFLEDLISSDTDHETVKSAIKNNAQEKALQILQLVPQTARTQIIDAALEAVTLEGDDAKNFIKNTLGETFDWKPLKAIAQEFIDNPTGK